MSALRRLPRRRHRSRGQALAEFALIMPIALLLLLAIGDFARLYTTAITVESAVREAADYGAFSGSNWSGAANNAGSNYAKTLAEMQRRACAASRDLPEYRSLAPDDTCTNPTVSITLTNPSSIDCTDRVPAESQPCVVHVRASYSFRPFFGGAGVAGFTFPITIDVSREASYVVSDFASS